MTGHAQGVITLNVAEADDAERVRRRDELHEPYRTLLGHLRHESGHYYWDRLIDEGGRLEAFRQVFGDESIDYSQALQRHYARRRPAGRLAGQLRQRVRDLAPVGGLGRDLGPLPAHGRPAGDGGLVQHAA